MNDALRDLLSANGGIDRSQCEGPAFDALCLAHRRRLGVADERALAARLMQDDNALHEFVAHIAVPETWFFRYPSSFEALRSLLAGRARPVRIASVGCATGQEAYCIAASALSALAPGGSVSVQAYDRNPVAIDTALRRDWNTPLALRGDFPRWSAPWAERLADGVVFDPRVISSVAFHHVPSSTAMIDELRGRAFDAIFCRNVLIYLDTPTRVALSAAMAQAIPVGGALFFGHAEVPALGPQWRRDALSESFAWHKGDPPPLLTDTTHGGTNAPTADGIRQSARSSAGASSAALPPAHESPLRSTRVGPRSVPMAHDATKATTTPATIAGASAATTLAQQVDALFAQSEDAMAQGDLREAYRILERVVYLAPQHGLAMLALASIAEGLGRPADAGRWNVRAHRVASRGDAS